MMKIILIKIAHKSSTDEAELVLILKKYGFINVVLTKTRHEKL